MFISYKNGNFLSNGPLTSGRYRSLDIPHDDIYRFFADGHWENDPPCTIHATNEFGGENWVKIIA
jgi:hypothetical protein